MLNQSVLAGRVYKKVEINDEENKANKLLITLAVPRSYKNEKGEYDTDFIDCEVNGNVAESADKYCNIGDLVGIKGSLRNADEKNNDIDKHTVKLIVEKITFLSSRINNGD